MRNRLLPTLLVLFCSIALLAHAGFNPFKKKHKRSGEENCQMIIDKVKKTDASFKKLFDNAIGWAVFPSIGKAGIGIGGAAGNGRVYRKGVFIGTTTMSQISVGFQLGGQVYSEIIFFQDDNTLNK
ncbi:MAG: hypothetical protein AB1403_00105, partial [Candidatus Riflebacteria bacterium]